MLRTIALAFIHSVYYYVFFYFSTKVSFIKLEQLILDELIFRLTRCIPNFVNIFKNNFIAAAMTLAYKYD